MTRDDVDPELAAQLNELGQLASGVGHHVINAFSAIVSNAELLRLMAESPKPIDPVLLADIIVRTAVEAAGVARRLIDFSRSATVVGEQTVRLDRLAAEVIEDRRANDMPGIDWGGALEPVPPICGNTVQLHAMLDHLIANAREAIGGDGGAITLSTGRDDRGWVVLEVRDTGRGMESHVLERAVEPFFTTKVGRFGVGLSIANGIWRRHHGTLALRSRPEVGTTVRLCVEPIRRPLPSAARPAETLSRAAGEAEGC